MKKVRTLDQLQDALDADLSWRLRELATTKRAIDSSKGHGRDTHLRAGLAMLYAHWEGFIRSASVAYGSYLSNQGLRFDQVKPCFMGIPAKAVLTGMVEANKPLALSHSVEAMLGMRVGGVMIRIDKHLRRVGNLNFDRFENVALSLGVPVHLFNPRKNLIDESLLRARNEIAHGEHLLIDQVAYSALSDEIIVLMRTYKTEIENAASTRSFLV